MGLSIAVGVAIILSALLAFAWVTTRALVPKQNQPDRPPAAPQLPAVVFSVKPEELSADGWLAFLTKARARGVRRIDCDGLRFDLDPELPEPPPPPKAMTPAELKQAEDDVLFHSVRS